MVGLTVHLRWAITLGPATLVGDGWEPNSVARIYPEDRCVVEEVSGKRLLVRCDGGQAWVDRSALRGS